MANLPEFLSRLQKVRKTGDGKWLARCCSHEDRSPSLSISERDDGRILLHCFAGCSAQEVVEAVGMELKDLMPENLGYHRIKPLAMSVNPRDALHAIRDDMTVLLVMAKMVQNGEEINTLLLAKLIGRLEMTLSLTGGH